MAHEEVQRTAPPQCSCNDGSDGSDMRRLYYYSTCDDIHPARVESVFMAFTASRTAADEARRFWAKSIASDAHSLFHLWMPTTAGPMRRILCGSSAHIVLCGLMLTWGHSRFNTFILVYPKNLEGPSNLREPTFQ